ATLDATAWRAHGNFIALFRQRANHHVQRFASPITHHFQFRLVTGFEATYQVRKIRRHDDLSPIEGENHIANPQTALGRRTFFQHLRDQRTCGLLETEGFSQVLVDLLNHYAQPTAADLAGVFQLVGHIHRDINRNGERQPHEAAGTGENLRIDTDYLTAQIE